MSTKRISRASEKHIGEALELPVKEDQKSENGRAPCYQTTPASEGGQDTRSIMTRLSILIFALATAVLVADQSALAQQSVSSYPRCLERGIGGPRSCYYSSYEQCWQEAFTSPDYASAVEILRRL
jgi:Protein of unknown function (DUF3551)